MLRVESLGDGAFAVVNEDGNRCRSYPSGAAAWGHAVWQPHNAAKTLPHASGPRGWFYADSRCGRTSDPRQADTIPLTDATPDQVEWARQGAANFIRHMLITDGIEVFTLSEDALADHDPSDYETDLIGLTHDEIHEAAEAAALEDNNNCPTEELEESLGPWTEDENPASELSQPRKDRKASSQDETCVDNPQDDAEQPASESADTDTGDVTEDVRDALSDSERNAFDNFSAMAADAPTESAYTFWQNLADEVLAGEWEQ